MHPAQRARILQLLPRMERPPGVEADEWEALLLLEAPSILGLAFPGSEELDQSEPTFPSESDEAAECHTEGSDDSLAGYSPLAISGGPPERMLREMPAEVNQ